ncbi:MAG: DNA polymerase III subunit gamma/tau [Rhizobiaceae bacterium]|nr:DNA polymerase III subunit gamma/tau [Rhizobiaceae bacterium]
MSDTSAESEYRVLARKYRPSNFDDLIGQEPMVRTLTNAFATNRIAQAYMLTGVRGVGKTTAARILARALNFESDDVQQPTLDLAGLGVHCGSIMEGNHVDVIEMDAASHTGIGDIREIIASVRYKPVSARYKVYIIDEVHMLSTAAFNGLLKTLEEPPEHVKFIFATTEIRKVPITVLSRCQRFDLRRIEAGELTDYLAKIIDQEGVSADPTALAMIARAAEGSVRDSLSLLDQAIAHAAGTGDGKVEADAVRSMLGLADRARVIDLFEQIMKGDISAALQELKEQYDVGADPATVLTDLAEFVHFVTRLRYVDTALNDPSLSEDEKTRGKAFSEQLSPRILGRAWQMLLKGIAEVQASPRPLAAADMVLVRLTHAADLPTPDEVIKKLQSGELSPPTPDNAPTSVPPNGGTASSQADANTSASTPISGGGDGGGGGGGVTTMRQVANGPTLVVDHEPQVAEAEAPLQRTAPKLVPVPQSTPPQSDAASQQTFEQVLNFNDLLQIAEKKRDIRFKLMLRNNFSEISFEPNRIEFHPVGNAPRDMAQIIDARLRQWTGQQWEIVVAEIQGGATIKEVETETRERTFAQAETDPVVAAVLKTFPKSKILDVRFPGLETEDGLDEASAQDAALDNPDDVEDTEDTTTSTPSTDQEDPGAGGLDDYFN